MPWGLYIWLAVSPSLYPPVWLITWRRVSTWNSRKQQTKQGQSQHKWKGSRMTWQHKRQDEHISALSYVQINKQDI